MGDYFKQTFEKCVLGVVDAAIQGRPISPSTEENCAVAARELREAKELAEKNPPKPKPAEKTRQAHHADAKALRKLMPPPKTRTYILLQENKVYDPKQSSERIEKLLKSSSFGKQFKKNMTPEQREQFLKNFGAEILLKERSLMKRLLQDHIELNKR
ncbi:MAG: hypothetical protein U1F66_00050 [bacterium]